MSSNETLKLKILDTEFSVKVPKGNEDKILKIEDYVNEELGNIKKTNQFANHIHIAILGCLNIAEKLFDKEKEVDDLEKSHADELVYYKNIESRQNEEQDKLDKAIAEKDKEIEQIKAQAQNEIDQLKEENQKQISKITRETELKISNIEKENNEALTSLRNEKDQTIQELTNSLNQKIDSIKEEKDREINVLKQHYEEEVNNVTDEKDNIILNLKEDRQAQIKQITQEKDAIISRLRNERENELRNLHQEKDIKIEQLTKENETLSSNNNAMTIDLDKKNELLNQYREKLKESKDENDINRQSIIDLQNQLFENQIELAKLQKRFENEGINLNSEKSSVSEDDQNLNDLIYTLKNQKTEEND